MGRYRKEQVALSDTEIAHAFQGVWSTRYPPILNVEQAAQLAHVSVNTIYDWSSRGLLYRCAHKKGKHLRLFRDLFVRFLFSPKE